MFTIKVKYGDDLRRFQTEESKLSWATFVPELIRRFELDITSQVSLRYEDEEGDKITVSSETEFREALVFSLKQRSTLKLEMTVSHLLPSSSSFDQPLLSPSLSSSLSLSASSSSTLSEPTFCPPSFEAQFGSFLGGSSSSLTPPGPSDPSQIVDELGSIFSGLSPFHAQLSAEPPAPLDQPEQPPSQAPFAPEPSAPEPSTPEPSTPEPSTPEPSIIPEPSPPAAPEQPVRPVHTGVICDGCRQTIAGFRFKCGHCPDFDLCEACEAAGAHFPNHFLIKIPFPIPPGSNSDWFAKRVFLPQVCLSEQLSLPIVTPPKPEPTPTLLPGPQRETPQEPPKKVETPKEPAEVAPSTSPPSTTEPEAKFVADVTIPDGTVVKPGASFTKTWTLKNSGEARWPMQSRLKMTGGTQMGALQSTVVASPLPGANVEISLLLTSPITPGRYVSYWRLHTPNGQPFGNRVWCDIVVLDPSSSQELPSEEEEGVREQSSPTPAPEQPGRPRGQSFVRETSPSSFIAPNVPVPDDERYEQEMKALLSMGFCDRTTNFRKLKEANGNLQVVVDQLLHEHEDDWFQRR